MDINSKDFRKKYIKSKAKVRQWENKFIAENGRLPTKVDIKSSSSTVREHYKLYWKLKTQILESQILCEESSDIHLPKVESILTEHNNDVNAIENSKDTSKKLMNSSNFTSTSKENINFVFEEKIDAKTWGNHLNITKSELSTEKEKQPLLNDAVAVKLFQGSSFKKRNPRKALPISKKKSCKSFQSENGSKSLDSLEFTSTMSSFSDSQNVLNQESYISFDPCTSEAMFSVENHCSPKVKELITTLASLSPTLQKTEKCRISEEKISVQPVSLIQVVASNPSVELKPTRNLDAGWVERCSELENKPDRKSSSDSGFESMELTLPECDAKDEGKPFESSDDDIIGSSDNELKDRSMNRISRSQKRKFDMSNCNILNTEVETKNEIDHVPKKVKVDPFEFVDETITYNKVKKAVLDKKIRSGTLSENFVKINIKKKVYVRGKKRFNFARYKKQEWKNKKKTGECRESRGVVQCFKCGETGHLSRYCQKAVQDKLMSMGDLDEEEESELPTLEEVKEMAKEQNNAKKKNVYTFEQPPIESSLLTTVEPYYQLSEDGDLIKTPNEVFDTLKKFGHSEFRSGQEKAIMRILSGLSTLLTISTGGGKSLCYQLPAYLYATRHKCITLVVSPLVSLMEDQVSGSSSFFKVGCLHTSQTAKQRETVLEDAKSGKLYALLISPEAVVSNDTSTGFGKIWKQLPPVAFACIDEVHCVSQWSHNFRPSYLMITKVLKNRFGIRTVLGLTATATVSTINSITEELEISSENGVIKDSPLPNNLILTVSRDENKDEALLGLLDSSPFKDSNAILVYCTRRDECERLAVLIRTSLRDPMREVSGKHKKLSWNAESYHAGMAAARRKQIQKAFMCGNLRIVVATVAFGMGINKQDIRSVIHYNMPKDFESYVQEVGRAGRDGKPAHCHLFLDSKGRDSNELKRHIHSNSVDRHVLRKLLQRVFTQCNCKETEKKCEGHEVAFEYNSTIQALDIPEENIYTLLCYLEFHEKKFAKLSTPVYLNCKITSYKGIKAACKAAKNCPPLAYAYAANSKEPKSSKFEFNVIDVANKLGWDSGLVKNKLKSTEWEITSDFNWKKTGITVDFSDLAFRVYSRGDLTPSELDEALNFLIERVENQEKRSATQLDIIFSTLDHFAFNSYKFCMNGLNKEKSQLLKQEIRNYFQTEQLSKEIPLKKLQCDDFDEEVLARDVRILVCTYRDNTFNGRAVARIFHGISSPNYPASLWYKCKFWRKHLDKDFNKISRVASKEIIRMKL